MIHYSCDRCQRLIETDDELRYTVHIEVNAQLGENVFQQDEERDHLLELHEILERHDDQENPLISDEVYGSRRYDLCSDCYQAFIQNPLGQDVPKAIGFSPN